MSAKNKEIISKGVQKHYMNFVVFSPLIFKWEKISYHRHIKNAGLLLGVPARTYDVSDTVSATTLPNTDERHSQS